ncbi:hypothetical protein CHU95_15660 [Niveispirillum lacus]|uniref:Uncharacterized protein n=1 Tax=Niveispirillum lacus TaxID=1981099 RepID=A0A255YX71_9PROT|nr:hypothetical protein [Niveispirillum lacus]OYQ33769.1 hypothetical protein CHU95_15660 [Niveispirillum lacus]
MPPFLCRDRSRHGPFDDAVQQAFAQKLGGDLDQTIALLQQALKGKLISPALVRLRLGMLQYQAGQGQAATTTLAALPPGSDEARLAGVWGLIYQGR